jgi:hypothetical protein
MRMFHAVLLGVTLSAAISIEAKAAMFACDYEVRQGDFNNPVVVAEGTVDQEAPNAETAQITVANVLFAQYGQDANPFHIVCRPK